MRLVFYNPTHPSYCSGPEVWLQEVLPRLVGAGHEVTLLTTNLNRKNNSNLEIKRLMSTGVEVTVLPSIALPFSGTRIPVALKRRQTKGVDILYYFNGYAFQDVVVRFMTAGRNVKIVGGLHAPLFTGYLLHDYYQKYVAQKLLAKTDLLHVLNKAALKNCDNLGAKGRLVPSGIESDFIASPKSIMQRTRQDYIQIIYAGRLSQQKNIPKLLEAMAIAMDNDPRIRFTVLGDGEFRAAVEDFVNRREKATYYGHVDQDKLSELLMLHQIFINMSRYETFCNALLEATAAGCRVLTTKTDGIASDYDFSYSYLDQSDSAEMVATKVAELVSSFFIDKSIFFSDIRKDIDVARDFTWDSVTSMLEKEFKEVISVY